MPKPPERAALSIVGRRRRMLRAGAGLSAILAGLLAGCAGRSAATARPVPVLTFDREAAVETAAAADAATTQRAPTTAPTRAPRQWPRRTVAYQAGNNWHWPLWFEDAPMERYGCSLGDPFQPAFSTGLAGIHFLALPYSAWRRPPWQRVYPSDWPDEPPPACMMLPPLDPLAALAEAGVVIGLIALVP